MAPAPKTRICTSPGWDCGAKWFRRDKNMSNYIFIDSFLNVSRPLAKFKSPQTIRFFRRNLLAKKGKKGKKGKKR